MGKDEAAKLGYETMPVLEEAIRAGTFLDVKSVPGMRAPMSLSTRSSCRAAGHTKASRSPFRGT